MNRLMTSKKLSDFDYSLPKELIAQEANPERTQARLLVLDRSAQTLEHKHFRDIIDYFEKGDVLVLNDTKVLPARFFAQRKTGAHVEILLLGSSVIASPVRRRTDSSDVWRKGTKQSMSEITSSASPPRNDTWRALIKPSGRIARGEILLLKENSEAEIEVLDSPDGETGIRAIQFRTQNLEETLNRYGHIPLPPYIDREDLPIDRELYQTVFAKRPGAVASPTAGLHFDDPLLLQLEAKGVEILFVTLHVSYGTFQPVNVEDLSAHRMYSEYCEISDETAERINFAKSDGRRVIACGTTVVRTLEACATNSIPSEVRAFEGTTDIFIYPPYEFKIVSGMITNFHLPKTTLLMLVSAFMGHEFLMKAYEEAIRQKYRFYSYGDATLIL